MDNLKLNVPALTQLLSWLEDGAPEGDNHGFRFNMAEYLALRYQNVRTNWCRTSCCMAGYIILNNDPEGIEEEIEEAIGLQETFEPGEVLNPLYDVDVRAREILGLTYSQADQLFFPHDSLRGMTNITPAQAAQTIRHLIETGEVKWAT